MARTTIRMLLAITILAAFPAGGDTWAKKVKGKREPVYPITAEMTVPAGLEIRVLPVKVETRSLERLAQRREDSVEEARIADWLRAVSIEILGERGFEALVVDPAAAPPGTESLVDLADRFVRGRLAPGASLDRLAEVCDGSPDRGVMFLHLEVKLATKGYWDAWSGGLKVGMSSSDLRGAIRDCETGETLWRGELYVRTVPRVGDARFERAVAGMYDNLVRGEDR